MVPVGLLIFFLAFGLPAFLLMLVFTLGYVRTRNVQSVLSRFAGLQVVVVVMVVGGQPPTSSAKRR